jgi:DNA-binding transcriptional MocR family regulator
MSNQAGIQIASGEWFGETKRFFRLGFGYMEIKQLTKTLRILTEIIRKIAYLNLSRKKP